MTGETRTEAGLTLTTTTTYDGAGRVLATGLPGGEVLTATRDAAGRVSQLASAHETLAQGLAYDAAGALTAQTLGNGVTDTVAVDADGQRTGQTLTGGGGAGRLQPTAPAVPATRRERCARYRARSPRCRVCRVPGRASPCRAGARDG